MVAESRVWSVIVSGAMLPIGNASVAVAQNAGAAVSNDPGLHLEEIVVTARKQEERLQDVPISITAFTAADIEAQGLRTFQDFAQSVPNFQFANSGTALANSIVIRGILSSDANPGFENTIATIIDDVYVGRSSAFNSALLDLERIEILRGPQGTLQGRNVVGGSINITTAKPSMDAMHASASASYGRYNAIEVRGMVTGPIVDDKLAGKIAVVRRERDGYGEVTNLDEDIDDEDHVSTRGQLLWTPAANLEILLSADYAKDEPHQITNDFGPPGVTDLDDALTDRDVQADFLNSTDREIYGGSARIVYDFADGYSLASVTAYRGYELDVLSDQDGAVSMGATTPGALVANSTAHQEQWQFSEELRLATPADRPLRGLVGLYYYTDEIESADNFLFGSNAGPILIGQAIIDESTVGTDSYAAFGSLTYDFTDHFAFTGGLRYTVNERDVDVTETLGSDGAVPAPPIPGLPPFLPYVNLPPLDNPVPSQFATPFSFPAVTDSLTDKEVTGDATFRYSWNDDVSAYVKYAHGFKGGGFNTRFNGGQSGGRVDPEFVESYEIGLRSYLLDRRLRLNATAFYQQYKDMQVLVFDPAILAFRTANADEAEGTGAEIEATAVITDHLNVTLGVGVLNSEFTAGANDGNDTQFSPTFSFSGIIDYVRPVSSGLELALNIDANYKDDYYTSNENTEISLQPSYWWINARGGIQARDGRWGVFAYGRNLLDEDVRYSALDLPPQGFSIATLQEPLTYGVEVTFKY
jgi:iron complex outermembrane receptor protein